MELEKEIKQSKFKSEHHKVAVNIIYTSNWLSSLHAKILKKHGITSQQFNVLRILRGQHPNPATVNLLIDRMLDKMSNASRLVDKLKAKGLVERKACKEDRRAVDVLITPKGLDLLAQLDKSEKEMNDSVSLITVSEAKELNRILDKMRG